MRNAWRAYKYVNWPNEGKWVSRENRRSRSILSHQLGHRDQRTGTRVCRIGLSLEGNSRIEIETNHFCGPVISLNTSFHRIPGERSSNPCALIAWARHGLGGSRLTGNGRANGRGSILTLRRLIAPRINHTTQGTQVDPFSNRFQTGSRTGGGESSREEKRNFQVLFCY